MRYSIFILRTVEIDYHDPTPGSFARARYCNHLPGLRKHIRTHYQQSSARANPVCNGTQIPSKKHCQSPQLQPSHCAAKASPVCLEAPDRWTDYHLESCFHSSPRTFKTSSKSRTAIVCPRPHPSLVMSPGDSVTPMQSVPHILR